MNARHWLLGMMVAAAGPVIADADVSGKEFDRFARVSAQDMHGAHVSGAWDVAWDVEGAVKWA